MVAGMPLATHGAFRSQPALGVPKEPEALLRQSLIKTKKELLPWSVSSAMVILISHHGPVGCSAAFAWLVSRART